LVSDWSGEGEWLRGFSAAQVVDAEWGVRQDLNLQPAVPKSEASYN
jgi:hypothetical protein